MSAVAPKSGFARIKAALGSGKAAATKLAISAACLGSGLWALSSAHWSGTVIITTLQFSSLLGPLGIFIATSATIIVYLAVKLVQKLLSCIDAWRHKRQKDAPILVSEAAPEVIVHPAPAPGGASFVAPTDAAPETATIMQNLFNENERLRGELTTVTTELRDVRAELKEIKASLSHRASPVPQPPTPSPNSPRPGVHTSFVAQGSTQPQPVVGHSHDLGQDLRPASSLKHNASGQPRPLALVLYFVRRRRSRSLHAKNQNSFDPLTR